jgi:hypothetical protein
MKENRHKCDIRAGIAAKPENILNMMVMIEGGGGFNPTFLAKLPDTLRSCRLTIKIQKPFHFRFCHLFGFSFLKHRLLRRAKAMSTK